MKRSALVAAALLMAAASGAPAQNPPTQEQTKPLEIGAIAPDFSLPGATRYGVLRDAIHLSDYQGKTVVLAFFFKARTKG